MQNYDLILFSNVYVCINYVLELSYDLLRAPTKIILINYINNNIK